MVEREASRWCRWGRCKGSKVVDTGGGEEDLDTRGGGGGIEGVDVRGQGLRKAKPGGSGVGVGGREGRVSGSRVRSVARVWVGAVVGKHPRPWEQSTQPVAQLTKRGSSQTPVTGQLFKEQQ